MPSLPTTTSFRLTLVESCHSLSIAIYRDQIDEVDRREALLLSLAFAFLCLITLALYLAPLVRLEVQSELGIRQLRFLILPVWVIGVLLVRREVRRTHPLRDPFLLPTGFLLAGWGLQLIWRLAPQFGVRQTGWFVIAVAVMLFILRGPTDLNWLRRYRYLWLGAGIILTTLTLVFGTNPSGIEPRLWLGCCGIYLQPSEPLRLLLIAFLASYLADHLAFRWLKDRVSPLWRVLVPLLVVWGLSVALLVVQRDLGTGTLFLAILAVLLYLISGRWQVIAAAGVFAVLGGVLGYALFDVVRLRLLAWLNPWVDPSGGSYQLVQSLIAVASGGVGGSGPGLGSPTFVPVVHSDFIFTAAVEEWGLLGGLGLILLFGILVTRGLRAASRCEEPFARLLSAGLAVAFGLQAVLIMGGTIRLLPLAGITLPFVSYGGSSLVTSFIGLSFLVLLSGGKGGDVQFSRPLKHIQGIMILAWTGLAVLLGWWSLYRAPELTTRTDNPRRGLIQKYSRRGRILDRDDVTLAESIGEIGDIQRTYPAVWAVTAVGFDSIPFGQSGIEASMDAYLRGEAGYDAFRIWWHDILYNRPSPGLDVRLSIDSSLQKLAVESLGSRPGVLVVLESMSGEVLTMLSSPSFDPNHLDRDWEGLTSRVDAPLLNRVAQGRYQPGMVLAPFLLAWALEYDFASTDIPVPNLTNAVKVDGVVLRCVLSPPSEIDHTLVLALQIGCPGPFADLGESVGSEGLEAVFSSFDFDQAPLIRLESVEISDAEVPENSQDVLQAAMGQGDLTLTPLQVARGFAGLLSDGVLPALHIVDAVEDPQGAWRPLPPLDTSKKVISPKVSQYMRDALRLTNDEGFGYSAIALSGGEADSIAWFLGSTLAEKNHIVVVVVLEGAEEHEVTQLGVDFLEQINSALSSP
jgi:cell division protein FtsW (lipid II flippase)/cell division protein FtsI/penicillin-binding protein 2